MRPRSSGRRVVALRVRDRRLRWPIDAKLESAVRGGIVRRVERRAKYLLIVFDAGTLIVHLGMSGSLRIVSAETPPRPHDHWDLVLDAARLLRFHDPRRFGSLHWTPGDPLEHPLLAKLGPEPLSAAFDAEYLYRATRKRSVAIKQLIMNSHVVVGVGNIYASEALFRARASPRAAPPAGSRGRRRGARARRQERARGSDRDRRNDLARLRRMPTGSPGYFTQKLFVYERAKQPCRVCKIADQAIRAGPAVDLLVRELPALRVRGRLSNQSLAHAPRIGRRFDLAAREIPGDHFHVAPAAAARLELVAHGLKTRDLALA